MSNNKDEFVIDIELDYRMSETDKKAVDTLLSVINARAKDLVASAEAGKSGKDMLNSLRMLRSRTQEVVDKFDKATR